MDQAKGFIPIADATPPVVGQHFNNGTMTQGECAELANSPTTGIEKPQITPLAQSIADTETLLLNPIEEPTVPHATPKACEQYFNKTQPFLGS